MKFTYHNNPLISGHFIWYMGSGGKSWVTEGNAIVVWLIIAGLFSFLVFSSQDYSKSYWNLDKFGANQLIMAGIITFLLLYRNISKIKIGTIIEIETREALKATNKGLNNTITAVDLAVQSLPLGVAADPKIGLAKEQIVEARKQLLMSKEVLDRAESF